MSDKLPIKQALEEGRIKEYLSDFDESKADTVLNFVKNYKPCIQNDVKQQMKEWVNKLRSGDYEQGSCSLVSADRKYCCLGVAGVVCGLDDQIMQGLPYPNEVKDSSKEALWKFLRKKQEVSMSLAVCNDGNMSFNEIADLIEWKFEL